MPKPGHVTLNFSPLFLERLRAYAKAHGMKVNAVLKRAFELLEDTPATRFAAPPRKAPVDDSY